MRSRTNRIETALQRFQLAGATDIGGESATERGVEAGGPGADGVQPIDLLRPCLAFDLVLAGEAGVDQSSDQLMGRLAKENGAGYGQSLQPRGQVNGVAERRHSCVVGADLGYYHWSCIDPDSHLRAHAMLGFDLRGDRGKPLLDQEPGTARAQRGILERDRHAKERHDPIAGEVLHRAALLAHGGRHQLINRANERERPFFPDPL